MKVDLFSIGRFTVHTYGVMIAIGVILCVLMGYYRAKRYEMKAESVLDLAILCVVMGFLGAKVFFVILSWKQFLADPLSVLSSSGFVVRTLFSNSHWVPPLRTVNPTGIGASLRSPGKGSPVSSSMRLSSCMLYQ